MDTGRADGGDEARYRRELPLREGMVVQEVGWSRDVATRSGTSSST
ncbi:hypothetical protein O4328_31075 [Rhodococcus opacus]|uniref:Uncharacterized protein n=1 Tax=Rhodococcus opacus TaxID=37919 RepID=A0ABT4NL48_RHOOP|nr:hypothetical protein [Rhodococcus opacus]